MTTLNEELAIERYKTLTSDGSRDSYRPNRDLRFYPGANLTAERRASLEEQAIEPDDLTADDIVYCLSKLVTATMYELIAQVEERWGKEAAREVVFEWARKRAREAITKWAKGRGITQLTPEAWARYQDLRHSISGPVHAHSFVSYKDSDGEEDVLEMDRTGCFFHTGKPTGMDSYSPYVTRGMALGYREVFPELTLTTIGCMGEGTSEHGCTLRFGIKNPSHHDVAEKVSAR